MGVLLYALLCGFLPFDDDNITFLYKKIQVCIIVIFFITMYVIQGGNGIKDDGTSLNYAKQTCNILTVCTAILH